MFAEDCCDRRIVLIPPGLQADQRARFIDQVCAAVRRQAELSAQCPSILRVEPDVACNGEQLVIRHEPAAGLDAGGAPRSALPDIASLWWVTRAAVEALSAGGADLSAHGGIQPAVLVQDEYGVVKLTDFGLAPAFETVCGLEARREVNCASTGDAAARERAASAVWRVSDGALVSGWIAPYFGHELLEDRLPLNARSDQFALGVLLFKLATGVHPYGASFDDPFLRFYFQIEPSALSDERADWRAAFERAEKQTTQPGDRPVLEWSGLVRRLLARDGAARFERINAAAALCRPHVADGWSAAESVIGRVREHVENEQIEPALTQLRGLLEDAGLPAAWRTRLEARCGALQRAARAGGAARGAALLADARAALETGELERALRLARRVQAAVSPGHALHAEAGEILTLCEEAARLIPRESEEVARAYLEGARQALREGRVADAALVLNAMMNDRGTPEPCKNEARAALAGIQRDRQRHVTAQNELAAGRQELARGAYEAARMRVGTLQSTPECPDDVRQAARELLLEIEAQRARRDQHAKTLDQARIAWTKGELDTLLQSIAQVPEDFSDPEIADVRRDLVARAEALRSALVEFAAATEAPEAGQVGEAVARVRALTGRSELPQVLLDQLRLWLRTYAAAGNDGISPTRLEELLRAEGWLDEAEAALQSADVKTAEGLLGRARSVQPPDPALSARCERTGERMAQVRLLLERVDSYRKRLEQNEIGALGRELSQSLADASLPEPVRRDLSALQASVGQRLAAHRATVDETLDRLELDLKRRRPPANFAARAAAVQADDLAAQPQKVRAAELLARLNEPPPAPPWWQRPAAAGFALVALAAIATAVYFAAPRATPAGTEGPNESQRIDPNVIDDANQPRDNNQLDPNSEPEPNEPNIAPVDPGFLLARVRDAFARVLDDQLGPQATAEVAYDGGRATVTLALPERGKPLAIAGVELPAPRAESEIGGALRTAAMRAEEAAARLNLMRDALDAVARRQIRVNLPDEYAQNLVIAADDRLEILPPETASRNVPVRSVARLTADDRANIDFPLAGEMSAQRLELDAESRERFFQYLAEFQATRAAAALSALRTELGAPDACPLLAPPDFAGGPALTITIGPAARPLAKPVLIWQAASCEYRADPEVAPIIAAALRGLLSESAQIEHLRTTWPALREQLAPDSGAAGSSYWGACELIGAEWVENSNPRLDSIPITLSVAPPGAADQRLIVPANVQYAAGRLEWREPPADARPGVAQQLATWSSDAQFRQRQVQAARASMPQVPGGNYELRIEGDQLTVTVEVDGRTNQVAGAWDSAALKWSLPEIKPPAPLPEALEPLLDALAGRPVRAAPLSKALAGIARAKAQRQNEPERWPKRPQLEMPTDEAGARAQLASLSLDLQRIVTAHGELAYPHVFIEYFAGAEAVYGLSWTAVADDQGAIRDVDHLRVWRVMDRATLDQLMPEVFRSEYSTPAGRWVESLLEPGLPPELAGTRRGTFGVMIAPDGPLWLTRWEQVRFKPRAAQGIGGLSEPPPAQVDWLRGLIAPNAEGDFRRAGLWCVPSLTVQGGGDPSGATWKLGKLAPQRNEAKLTFRPRGVAKSLLAATIEDFSPDVDKFKWADFERQLEARECGAAFWNFGWENDAYKPQSIRGLSLFPLAP